MSDELEKTLFMALNYCIGHIKAGYSEEEATQKAIEAGLKFYMDYSKAKEEYNKNH